MELQTELIGHCNKMYMQGCDLSLNETRNIKSERIDGINMESWRKQIDI
jgi:hypothetical protein